jgi:dTDP-D-glucose 4,6-dehydratase
MSSTVYHSHSRNYILVDEHSGFHQLVDNESQTKLIKRWNVCGEGEYNNLEVVNMIAEIMNVRPLINLVKPNVVRPGYDKRYLLDGYNLAINGWRPSVDFRERLREVVEWTLTHKEFLERFDYANS